MWVLSEGRRLKSLAPFAESSNLRIRIAQVDAADPLIILKCLTGGKHFSRMDQEQTIAINRILVK